MSQTDELIKTLKRYLKIKDITYQDIGREMGLSETSIKRLFSLKTFSLKQLEKVCEILDMDLYDLATMSKQHNRQMENSLTQEQEHALAEDPVLMAVFYFLVNGWSLESIVSDYVKSHDRLQKMLFNLDRMGLIELHPGNRIRVLFSKNIFWQKNGPVWQVYRDMVFKEFMDEDFEKPSERFVFLPGVLSESSMATILKQLDRVRDMYNELAETDTAVPVKERTSAGLLIAFRPWAFSMWNEFRKKGKPE
jgi:transcriptional regulator with XRE-family HTH domain